MKTTMYALLAAAATLALTGSASATTMIGATVNVSARYPNTNTVFADGGNKVVSDAVEYGVGSFANYNPGFSVDVQADRIVLNYIGNPNFGTADFNGFVLQIISGPALTSATIDPTSAFSPISATVTGGNLFLNYSGVQNTSRGTTSIIRFDGFSAAGAVPEVATWAMMLAGFGAIGCALRQRRSVTTRVTYAR